VLRLERWQGRIGDGVRGGGGGGRRTESRARVGEDGDGVGDVGERIENDGYDRGSES